jgi:2-oxoglutarate ferredoxin oxidoreductase subunit alpha
MADRRMLTSIYQPNIKQEQLCKRLAEKHRIWEQEEVRYESYRMEDAQIVLFAYGSVGRVCKACVDKLRSEGIKAGVFRPITLYPFPIEQIRELPFGKQIQKALCVEMSTEGKMIEDVQRAVAGQIKVEYLGRGGGFLIRPTMVLDAVRDMMKGV